MAVKIEPAVLQALKVRKAVEGEPMGVFVGQAIKEKLEKETNEETA